MDTLSTAAGAALIAVTLRDIFETLFHPLGRGSVERWIVGGISWVGRRVATRVEPASVLTGPLSYIPHALKVRGEMLGMAIDDYAETLRTRLRMHG